jgi:DNA modification methylase
MTYEILLGDCIASMRGLPDQSVHTCVTSPPYFGLRDYGMDGQIGLEATPDAFVARLVEVFREVRRVLRDDGTLFLNLGDSYFAGGGRRAATYGTSGTEPAGSQGSDCLCGSLCDACRTAYRIGKSHSDAQPAPMLDASTRASSHAHMGSLHDHLPTSGLTRRAGHSEAANPDLGQTADREGALLPDAPASTPRESSQQHQEDSHLSGQPLECRLCGYSLQGSALASAHMAECNCGTSARGSVSGISGKGAVSSAYPHLTTESLKPKDLIGVPWRVAFALQADGWYLRQDIIWHKPNPMPESVRDRCTKAHEYLFLLSKGPRYFYDADAIKEPAVSTDIKKFIDKDKDKQRGHGRRHAGFNGRYAERLAAEGVPDTRNRRSVWTVATKPFSGAHFATFPPDLIEPCILAGSPVGGTVLDPFGGSGTTAGVALKHGRKAILCELNPAYAALMPERILSIAGDTPDLFLRAAE